MQRGAALRANVLLMLTVAYMLIAAVVPSERIAELLPIVKNVAEVSWSAEQYHRLLEGGKVASTCATLVFRSGAGAVCSIKSLRAVSDDFGSRIMSDGETVSVTCAPMTRADRPKLSKACDHLEPNIAPTDGTRLLRALIENNTSIIVKKLSDMVAVELRAFDASSIEEESEIVVWRDDRMVVMPSGCSPVARMDPIVGFGSLLVTCAEELVDAGAANRGWRTVLRVFDIRSGLVELPTGEMEIAHDEHPSSRDIVVASDFRRGQTLDVKKLTARCALEPQVVGRSLVLSIRVSPTGQAEMQAIASRAGRWCFDAPEGWARCFNP